MKRLLFIIIILLLVNITFGKTALDYYEMGYISYMKGKLLRARKFFEKAIELEPNLQKAHYWLGKVLNELGMLKEATFHWEEALKIRKKIKQRILALKYKSDTLPSLKKIKEVKERTEKANVLYQKYLYFIDKGQWQAAYVNIKGAIKLYPSCKRYLKAFIKICIDKDEILKAYFFYKKLLKLYPEEKTDTSFYSYFADRLKKETVLKSVHSTENFAKKQLSILKKSSGMVVLNGGFDIGLKLSDEYRLNLLVYAKSDDVLMPKTIVGELLITKVFKDKTWAIIKRELNRGIKKGDIVDVE